MAKERMRINISVDAETYDRAERMARRMGFRSTCAMTAEMLTRITHLPPPTEQEVDSMEAEIASLFNGCMCWDEQPSADTRIRMRLRN